MDKTDWLSIFSLFYFLFFLSFFFFKWKRCTNSICVHTRLRAQTLGITETGTGQKEINRITACEGSERNVLKTNICALSRRVGAAADDKRCDIVIFQCEINVVPLFHLVSWAFSPSGKIKFTLTFPAISLFLMCAAIPA